LWRLVVLQLAVHAVTFSLTAVFAPRVLLLEGASLSASLRVIGGIGILTAVFSTLRTWLCVKGIRRTLSALSEGQGEVAPDDLVTLHSAPASLALFGVVFSLLLSLSTLVTAGHARALDSFTHGTLIVLMLTLVSTGALLAYVTMRSAVARVVELAPALAVEQALRNLGKHALGRARKRIVAAVAAPVAFVAMAASLLVDAHATTYARQARITDAVDVAHAVLDPSEGDDVASTMERDGQMRAIEAAFRFGYSIEALRAPPSERVMIRSGNVGETSISLPLRSGGVQIRVATPRVVPIVGIYVLLAVAAVALAAIVGTLIGGAFEFDLALATREVRRAGVAELFRGTIISHEGRFASVRALLAAVDVLGGVFRQFAGAQQRSIDAREATERMRGLLLASMSHDLKAPLNAVLGFSELVGRGPLSEPQRESLAIIEQRGRELLMLIDTILDSARAEAGELEIAPSKTHVGDVVMSSVLEARDHADGTTVQILGEIQPGMPTICVDDARIVQALTAIVMTAARFSDHGVVHVRATLPDTGARLRVEVETSGEGLPVFEREKIFDAFKSATSARRHGALGLGLQLARAIVEMHGGTIEVDNTDHGGMIFRVWLPVAK
jgi:signal transduction histidine kinase